MTQQVIIKGMKSGIILVLDPDIAYKELRPLIAQKIDEAASFLGNSKMGLAVKGRKLTDKQIADVIEIIASHSKISIVCVIDDDGNLESLFEEQVLKSAERIIPSEKAVEPLREAPDGFSGNAYIYKGSVRSGQSLSSEQSLIILGDVNPGGNAISSGCIFIMGSLMGNAFAGASGNRDAFIMADDFHPLQVRIADAIAVSPDDEGGRSGKFLGRINKNVSNEPEVAYIVSGQIARSRYDAAFIKQSKFF